MSLTPRAASPNHAWVLNGYYTCNKCQHSLFLFMTFLIIISLGTCPVFIQFLDNTGDIISVWDDGKERNCRQYETSWCFLMFWGYIHMTHTVSFLFSSHKSSGWHIANAHGHIWVFLLPIQGNFLPSTVVLSQIKNDHWRKHSLSEHSAASYSWQVTKASQMAYHVSERCSDTKWGTIHMDL